jgi:hypothetical protein
VSRQRAYTGHSGQMAVMAELLHRQCNVAIPDVDYGTDVFAFHDESEETARIQVKTAQGRLYLLQEGYSAQFDIPMRQLRRDDRPPLFYALAVRLVRGWGDFVVISRRDLQELEYGEIRFGTENLNSGNLVITVQFRPERVNCGKVDMTMFRNAWNTLPPLRPLTEI